MKTLLTLAALAALSTPAHALTLEQAMNEVAGMHCSGSSCTSKATGSVTTTAPDTYVSTGVTDLNTPGGATNCFTGSLLDGPFADGKRCTPAYTLAPGGSGYTIPGTSTTSATCTTTTKTITYNGPFTSRDTAWSVDTSVATVGGGC